MDEIELKDPNSASPSLLKARSYVIPNDKCKKLYPNVDAGNICTLGARTGGTCRVRIINDDNKLTFRRSKSNECSNISG